MIRYEFIEAISKYPKLQSPINRSGLYQIYGFIDVIAAGKLWDTYNIVIEFPFNYPYELPKLYEIGTRITRHQDWHINKEGNCCLSPRAKEIQLFTSGGRLIHWLDNFVHPFLANHKLKTETGKYASEGYSHGSKGIIEYYIKWLNLKNKNEVLEKLRLLTGSKKADGNDKCPCGNGKESKDCHDGRPVDYYLGVPLYILRADLLNIESAL